MSRSLSRTRGTAAALVLALPAALLTIGAADAAPGKPGAKPTAPTTSASTTCRAARRRDHATLRLGGR